MKTLINSRTFSLTKLYYVLFKCFSLILNIILQLRFLYLQNYFNFEVKLWLT